MDFTNQQRRQDAAGRQLKSTIMPHDKNGKPLFVGSLVMLACTITAIQAGETACNVTAEAFERPEGESYIPQIAGNSRFYVLAESTPSALPSAWMPLLTEAANHMGECETSPGPTWWKRYFQITGDHMILTDEGWEHGSTKGSYVETFGAESILDEVNAPGTVLAIAPPEVPFHVAQTKQWRKDLDGILQAVKKWDFTGRKEQILALAAAMESSDRKSFERAVCIVRLESVADRLGVQPDSVIKITEAIMWLGMDLKAQSEPDPYPERKNPDSARIEPTADNLAL